ncbi:MAG TPA: response regulator transcription factor [Bacillota bacterium]|nr:response regulator transcription factor [Bacillota bacterium]
MITILIVDDDPHIRELLNLYLRRESYNVLEAEDGHDALLQLDEHSVQLAIVDIMMPHMDGYELCEHIRELFDIPVMMVTAKGELADKEKAYTAGTDDYLVKPFEPKEVLFRVKALLRRFQMLNKDIIQIGQVRIDRISYKVHLEDESMILPLKEFDLLTQLASYPERTFTREQLINLVWENDFTGNDRTVDVHIKRLRERFKGKNTGFDILTVRGLGYKLEII